MGKWIGDFGNWLMTHLVALGFVAFAVVGIVFYEPIFDAKQPPKGPPPEQAAVTEARVRPAQPAARRPVAPEQQDSQFRPLLGEAETGGVRAQTAAAGQVVAHDGNHPGRAGESLARAAAAAGEGASGLRRGKADGGRAHLPRIPAPAPQRR